MIESMYLIKPCLINNSVDCASLTLSYKLLQKEVLAMGSKYQIRIKAIRRYLSGERASSIYQTLGNQFTVRVCVSVGAPMVSVPFQSLNSKT